MTNQSRRDFLEKYADDLQSLSELAADLVSPPGERQHDKPSPSLPTNMEQDPPSTRAQDVQVVETKPEVIVPTAITSQTKLRPSSLRPWSLQAAMEPLPPLAPPVAQPLPATALVSTSGSASPRRTVLVVSLAIAILLIAIVLFLILVVVK